MITYIFLSFSVVLNVFFIWYVKELLKRFSFIGKNSHFYHDILRDYEEHLDAVYNLPMFYGEETLKGLLNHTRAIIDSTEEIKEMFNIREEEITAEEETTGEEEIEFQDD